MRHSEGCLSRTVHAIDRIGIHTATARALQVLQVVIAQLGTIIHILGLFVSLHIQNHCRVLGLEDHRLCLSYLSRGEE